jgi:hypothetical protein
MFNIAVIVRNNVFNCSLEITTLLQKQNSFPSLDGNGAPKSVNFVDVG